MGALTPPSNKFLIHFFNYRVFPSYFNSSCSKLANLSNYCFIMTDLSKMREFLCACAWSTWNGYANINPDRRRGIDYEAMALNVKVSFDNLTIHLHVYMLLHVQFIPVYNGPYSIMIFLVSYRVNRDIQTVFQLNAFKIRHQYMCRSKLKRHIICLQTAFFIIRYEYTSSIYGQEFNDVV